MKHLILIFTILFFISPLKSQNDCDSSFVKAEFDGNFRKYLAENLRYPLEAQRNKIEGTLIIGFKINKSGKLDSIGFVTIPHESMVDDVTKVLVNSGKNWTSTICNKNPIDFTYYIIINYLIKNGNSEPKSLASQLNENAEKRFNKGQNEKALEMINQAISLNPYQKSYYKLRADIYFHLNNEAKAKKDREIIDELERNVIIEDFNIIGLGVTTTRKRIY